MPEYLALKARKHMKKKVLIVGGFPPQNTLIFGGIVTSCQTLLNSSFADHYELILLDSTQISNPPPSILKRSYFAFFRVLNFSKIIIFQDTKAIILFMSGAPSSILEKGVMAWLAKIKKKNVLIFPRGGKIIDIAQSSRYHKIWIATMMQGATHILCQGKLWQEFAKDTLKFPLEKTTIIHNWTATNQLLTIGQNRKFKKQGDTIQLLFLGWLEENKGIFDLLNVCLLLSHTYDFKLVIAGRGHAEEDARSFIESNQLDTVVEFAGWVQGYNKEELLAKSDILVLPSWAEGFPNAIIEAMSTKMAVITSSVGNIPTIIANEIQALLIPAKNRGQLQLAIEQLLLDSHFREDLSERGYAFAKNNFSIELASTKLITLIDSFS